MPPRSSACHVAAIRRTVGGKTYSYALLRRSFRQDGKVKHQTLGNLSHLPVPVIDLIRRAVRGEPLVVPGEAFEILRSRPHGHVAAVLERHGGLDQPLPRRPCRERSWSRRWWWRACLIPAQAGPGGAGRRRASSMLGERWHESAEPMATRRDRCGPASEMRRRWRSGTDGTLVLYDVTTYFEGRNGSLATIGYSRWLQRIAADRGGCSAAQGCPVAVEVFRATRPIRARSLTGEGAEAFRPEPGRLRGDRG
jgi:hypothetical protein